MSSCTTFQTEPDAIRFLQDNKLFGWWSDYNGSDVKIYCEGQFEYERDFRVNNEFYTDEAIKHYAGVKESNKGGRIRSIKDNQLKIIPLGKKYKIDQLPILEKNKLKMIFEGKKYELKESFICNN